MTQTTPAGQDTPTASATPVVPVTVTPVPWDHPAGVLLRTSQQEEIRAMYGESNEEPGTPPSADDIAVFLLATAPDGEAVGCGALRQLGPDSAEIKRMYVAPQWRGRGVAEAVLAGLEQAARERGWPVLRLETGPEQVAAIRFYTRSGYVRIPNFGHYADAPDSLCYERVLEIV